MKKTYQEPTIKVVNIKPAMMIAASEDVRLGGTYNEATSIQGKRRGFAQDDEDVDW